MATFTYIQIYDHLKDIADSHSQIKSFGFGDIWEMNTSGTINYPLMFVVPQGGVVRNNEVGNKFKILVMDLVKRGEVNETDVLNDTQRIALDVIASLRNSANADWLLKEDSLNLEDFTERFTDSVAGWAIDLTLWVEFTADRCAIPGGIVTSTGVTASVTVKNSDSTYSKVENTATHNLPDVIHTDSDGSAITKPGMTALVCTPLGNHDFTDTDGVVTSVPSSAHSATLIQNLSGSQLNSKLTQSQRDGILQRILLKTGQTTSYASEDDGDLEKGFGPNFTTLPFNNSFGNTNRFTDSLGTQIYANSYLIDHATGLGWYILKQTAAVWATAMSNAAAFNTLFTDWRIPNINEMNSLFNRELGWPMNYAPFNFGATIITYLWTSTTMGADTTFDLTVQVENTSYANNGICFRYGKTNSIGYLLCRNHF